MRLKRFTLLSLLFLSTLFARANKYIVTSNADVGPGTLREALAFANSHPGLDSILFNLADTSVTGRTIMLLAPLDEITDQLLIDGTTQPGIPFGMSQAKVQLTANNPLVYGLKISSDSCDVYGMFIQNFQKGIIIWKRYNQIGAVGKGNVIFNCTDACVQIYSTNHGAFLSNFIGVDTMQQVGSNLGIGLWIQTCFAVAVGGKNSDGRNIISGNTYGIKMVHSKFVDLNANYIGTDLSGLTAIPNQYGIFADSNNVNIEIGGDSLYEDNLISGNTFSAIAGQFIASTIQGNFIGTDVTGTAPLGNGTYGIDFFPGSNTNNVGGKFDNDGNVIANNGSEAVYLGDSTCYNITVFRNSIFCNSKTSGTGGITLNGGNINIQPPTILIANPQGVSGIAAPNGTVDVFLDDTCTFCEGGTLVGSANVDPSGVFKLDKDVSGTVTATSTDVEGNTSIFTGCTTVGNPTCLITNFILPAVNQCPGIALQFTDQTVTAPGTNISTWKWTWGDGATSTIQNPTHTYSSGGDFTITLTVTNSLGCLNSTSKSYTVSKVPVANFTSSLPVCVGTAINFTDQSNVAEGDTLTAWSWSFGDGDTSSEQNPSHTYLTAGTFTVSLDASGLNCTDNDTSSVHIYALPIANFSAPPQVCKASDFSFTDLSTADNGDQISSWFWDFGDGNSSEEQNPDHMYAEAGTYTVTLSVTGTSDCSGEYSSAVEAVDFPTALYSSASLVCAGNEISFSDQSTTGGDVIVGWSWDFGDGATSTDQNPVHAFSIAGTYLVSLSITTSGGCSGEFTSDVIVVDPPSTLFSSVAAICVGSEITFSDESTASVDDQITGWSWDFGDGNTSSEQNPAHTYTLAGTFSVSLTVSTSAGCNTSYSSNIDVIELPTVQFSYPVQSCVGNEISFIDESTAGNVDTINSWNWDFGDLNSSSEQNPVHTYNQTGTFNVLLKVGTTTGCGNSYSSSIEIFDQPQASFSFSQAGLTVTFENTSTDNGNASYSWDFADGNSSTEENPEHQYSSGGVYNVCLTVFDSTCMTSSTTCSVVDLPTGIDQVANARVTIYPNPANDLVTISGLNESGIETVSLFNSIGQRMMQLTAPANADELQINTHSLVQGIYTIVLRKTDESVLQKKINVIH